MQHFFDKVNAMIQSRYEYETQHPDAGDAYAHLASDGDFDYHNGESRLAEYCAESGIDTAGVDLDTLAQDVIFWGYMTPGAAYDAKRRFLVASYQVGEIECQVDSVEIGARFTPYLIDKLNRNTDAHWQMESGEIARFYIVCDSYWDHVCDLETIKDLVDDK